MLLSSNQQQRMMMRRSDNRIKQYQQNIMPSQMNFMQRGMVYPYKEPCFVQKIEMKNEVLIRKAITVKVPTTPKRVNDKKEVAMVSSPEVKVNFDHLDNKALFQKDLCSRPSNRFEDIPTAHTSTESLLSANNGYNKIMVRSQDNLMPPFMQSPYMCYPVPPMMNNTKQQPFFQKRKMSYAGGLGVQNITKRNIPEMPQYTSSKKPIKSFYNKFNSPNEQNENTVILEIQCQIAKNDKRVFKLKKYDDLFTTLQQFIDMNQIRQELIQPIASLIFSSLNKIFWLCNNKIGRYDQNYLISMQRLWKKNREKCLVTRNSHSSKNSDSDTSCSSLEKDSGSKSFNYYQENNDDETKSRLNKSFS